MNNQSYVYEESNDYEEGITFKKVGHFFKKGWLRMLIYVVVLALLTTAIAVPIKVLYKSEPIAQTSIEYIYEGIENGLDPNGKTLDTDNIISMTVLKNAVEDANLGGVIKDITTLRDSMRVEGVETDEYVKLVQAAADGDSAAADRLRNYTMYPTRFDIIISDPSELGLSDDQAKLLLNKIVSSYYSDFQQRFSVTEMFASDMYTLSQNEMLEFTEAYDRYIVALNSIKSYITGLAAQNSTFVSTANNTTFTQLLSELNILSSSYSTFNAYILSNNIWRSKTAARDNLTEKQKNINNELDALNDYITALNNQLAAIQPDTTTSGTGETQTIIQRYPEYYYELQAKLDAANSEVRDYQVQLSNIKTRLEKLTDDSATDAALIAKAQENLAALENQSKAFVEKVNATVEDYYNTTFISSSVRQVQQPVVTRRSNDLNLLIVYLIVVIAGLLIAGIVTGIKISKANAIASKLAEEKSAESATDEADNNKDNK